MEGRGSDSKNLSMKSSPINRWGARQYTWDIVSGKEFDDCRALCDCMWYDYESGIECSFCWSKCDNCLGYGTMPIDWSEVS